jgi:diacylglycerol kinase
MEVNKSLLKSFKFAFEGIHLAYKYNRNIRIHSIVAIFVIILSLILQISWFEFGLILMVILLVIAAEMINTAIEEMVDLITEEHRQQAKIAKDAAAGMVLVTAIGSVVIGVVIFLPYLLEFLG